MARRVETLKKIAKNEAELRYGHSMGRFKEGVYNHTAKCEVCGDEVKIPIISLAFYRGPAVQQKCGKGGK